MIGQIVNNYEVRGLLGEGMLGWVYLAEHPVLGRRAALRVLRRDFCEQEPVVTRFLEQVRMVNALAHPHIASVLDLGRLPDGLPYVMVDLLDGESLSARLQRQGRLTLEQAAAVVSAAASALGTAHRRGVIHGDVKPGNLFLARDLGDREQLKVLDFGVSKLRSELGGGKHSGGAQLGTPSYLAPEQCRDDPAAIDARADVYALGTILYEMLCGRPPFMGPGATEVRVLHLQQVPPAPRVWNPGLSAAVEAVILRALAKAPGDRFASMAELSDALQAAVLAVDSGALALPPPIVAPVATPAPISVFAMQPEGHPAPVPAEITAVIRRRRRRWLLPVAGAATAMLATVWLSAVPLSGLETPPPATPSSTAALAPPRAAPSPPPAPPAPLPPPLPALARNHGPPARVEARVKTRHKRPTTAEARPLRRRTSARTPRQSRPSAAAPHRPGWMDKW